MPWYVSVHVTHYDMVLMHVTHYDVVPMHVTLAIAWHISMHVTL